MLKIYKFARFCRNLWSMIPWTPWTSFRQRFSWPKSSSLSYPRTRRSQSLSRGDHWTHLFSPILDTWRTASSYVSNMKLNKCVHRWQENCWIPFTSFLFFALQISGMGTREGMGRYLGTGQGDLGLPLRSPPSTWSIKPGEILQQSFNNLQNCDLFSSRLLRTIRCSWIARHWWPGCLHFGPSCSFRGGNARQDQAARTFSEATNSSGNAQNSCIFLFQD